MYSGIPLSIGYKKMRVTCDGKSTCQEMVY